MTINERLTTVALLVALIEAERFICGFEGDELQEPSVDPLLARIRGAIAQAAGRDMLDWSEPYSEPNPYNPTKRV